MSAGFANRLFRFGSGNGVPDDIYYLQTDEDLGTQQGDPHFRDERGKRDFGRGFVTERGHGNGYQGNYFTKTICTGRFANDSYFDFDSTN